MSNSLRSLLFRLLPRYNTWLYRVASRYVDRYHNNNDSRMERNGELDVLRKLMPQMQVVFDVGANVGEWLDHVLAVQPAAQVHCFEPHPTTFERLSAQPRQANVTYNNAGLGSEVGEATLYIAGTVSGINSLYENRQQMLNPERAGDKPTVTIQLNTLDAYCTTNEIEQIDYLKIDVEGHELEVLKGAGRLLTEGRIRIIQFEYDRSYLAANLRLKDMFDLLQGYGYRLYKIYPQALREFATYPAYLENFTYQNWVASLEHLV